MELNLLIALNILCSQYSKKELKKLFIIQKNNDILILAIDLLIAINILKFRLRTLK